MRASFFGLGVSLALVGLSSAIPAESRHNHMGLHMLAARAAIASPDNTCGLSGAGANNGYSCNVTLGNSGGCCSGSGYCGTTDDYCASGCQSAYGICNAEAPVSNTGSCGTNNGGACTGGLCCSGAGWCGNTTDYCLTSNGCQTAFGLCNADAPASPDGNTCGPQNGNTICPDSQCCSVSGFCGTTADFCSDPNNCAPGFGRCDSDTTPAGASTQNVARPLLGSVVYGDDVYDCVSSKVVALSFDDGPYLYTAGLLDLLKTYGFTATFFISGNNNGRGAIDTTDPYPSIIKRMIAEGHQVASHTWSHYSLDNSTQAMRISQMVKNEMAINNIIGKFPTYMRPPYSQCTTAACKADMKTLGYHIIYFDLDTQDYLNPLPAQIQNSKNIVSAALKSAATTADFLSIQHDIVQQSATNLSSYYFEAIKAKGWKGVTVGECLGDPQANWYRTLSAAATTAPVIATTPVPVTTPTTTSVPVKVVTTTSTTAPAATTPATAPVTKCDATIGKFCGKINTFNSAATCSQAVMPCNMGYMTCLSQGWSYMIKCLEWTRKCSDLNYYCRKCNKSCSNNGFALSTLG